MMLCVPSKLYAVSLLLVLAPSVEFINRFKFVEE
jgi:hypothetical protein